MKRKRKVRHSAEPVNLAKLYPSFPVLVWNMILDGPEQTVQEMADQTKIDHSTLMKWIYGRTKLPPLSLVIRWAKAMGLPAEQVADIVHHDAVRYAMGIQVALPDVDLSPGPRPSGAPRRAKVIPIAGGSSNDRTPGVPQVLDLLLLVGHWLQRMLHGWYPRPAWPPRLAWA